MFNRKCSTQFFPKRRFWDRKCPTLKLVSIQNRLVPIAIGMAPPFLSRGNYIRVKKSPKEASKTFHDIMKASVKGNPKSQPNQKRKRLKGRSSSLTMLPFCQVMQVRFRVRIHNMRERLRVQELSHPFSEL